MGTLKTNLEGFGLTCGTAGRNFGQPSANADLVIIDLFLGSGQRPDDMEVAIEGLTKVIEARSARPPIVILMSRSSRLADKREEFRDRCGLFASAFRIIRKDDLSDNGKLGRLLARLGAHFEDSLKLANFVDAWRRGLNAAQDRTSTLIRRLELSDHAQIRQLLLSTEGEPTGSYLVDVFDAVLRHEIEREAPIIDGASALNTLTSDVYPPPYLAGSRDLQDLVYRSLFQNRERLRLQGAEGSRVAFGDLLMRKTITPTTPAPRLPSYLRSQLRSRRQTALLQERRQVARSRRRPPRTESKPIRFFSTLRLPAICSVRPKEQRTSCS